MCLPCQAQITHLKEVKQHFGDNVIIISIGIFGDTNQELETFKENRELTWRFAADADYSLTTRYNIEGAPYLMIIDVNGNIRFAHLDLIPSATLIQKVDEIM
jgi:peroxiredoxin